MYMTLFIFIPTMPIASTSVRSIPVLKDLKIIVVWYINTSSSICGIPKIHQGFSRRCRLNNQNRLNFYTVDPLDITRIAHSRIRHTSTVQCICSRLFRTTFPAFTTIALLSGRFLNLISVTIWEDKNAAICIDQIINHHLLRLVRLITISFIIILPSYCYNKLLVLP